MCIRDRPRPFKLLETGVRVIDTLNPIVEGGTAVSYTHLSQFGSKSATRLREAGFASNRASAMAR